MIPTSENFHELSYKLHEKLFAIGDNKLTDLQKSWFRKDTVGYWRFFSTFKPIIPILKQHPKSSWLTIGDGRFGRDAIELKDIEPSLRVLPTDISPALLNYAKKEGLIEDYRKENAEALSFQNESFDFVLCRESYHHFPRPAMALYEMLRVAQKAVILTEPNEHNSPPLIRKMFRSFKNFVKHILNRPVYHPDHWNYEEAGNYIFLLSKREIEKIALGLNMPSIAYHYYNDYYEKGIEFEKADNTSALFRKVKKKIIFANLKSKTGLKSYSGITAILFKEMPDTELVKQLKKSGFRIVELPRNPYIK